MAVKILKGEPIVIPETPILQEIIDSFKRHGERVYLDDARTKKQSTFRQVLDNAGAISSTLRKLGQGPGKVVMLLSDTSVEALTTNFGIWLSGAASLAVNPNLPIGDILHFVKPCYIDVLFCGEEYLNKVKEIVSHLDWSVTIICPSSQDGVLDYYRCLEHGNSAEGLVLEGWWTGKDHTLGIFTTSGTTGVPKGIVVGQGTFITFNENMKHLWTDSSVLLLHTPLYWISNAYLNIITACSGSKIVIASQMSNEEIMKTITEYKPTDLLTGPAILIDVCKEDNIDKYDFSSFKNFYIGGYVLLPEQRKMITKKVTGDRHIIRHMYGSTETGMVTFDKTVPDINSPNLASVGKVAKGVEIKVVDEKTGEIQPPYTPGKICVKSEGIMKRYHDQEELTEENIDKDGFFLTGDLGYYDDEDNFFFSSRLNDVMKYRGQKYSPAELENILQKHPDVLESCVVGKTCIGQGELPAAFIVTKPGSILTENELYSFVSDNVIDEKKLRGGIFFVESLPKNGTGKVLRDRLKNILN